MKKDVGKRWDLNKNNIYLKNMFKFYGCNILINLLICFLLGFIVSF